ncbi:hypothetical protein [Ferruginibacter sp. HRS2-29]|uniref:hypothetical protein n=1 Tax=Ferruginibacter sp. HRS2-29 TaxID=2487334 RepID=UPI0020CCF485|nr:hypothetical protein [Ferruginibacter sp. HRS2-29]MCP9752978.1 hypothetical protein [Ferruginibacter sp. HRS2-29]
MKHFFTLSFIFVSIFFFSCSKDSTSEPDPNSGRLTAVTFKFEANQDKMLIYYDQQNRVDSMVAKPTAYEPGLPHTRSSFSFKFTYQGNNTLPAKVLYTYGYDVLQYIDHSLTYDAEKRVQEDKVHIWYSDPSVAHLENWDTIQFHYAGNKMYHEEYCGSCPPGTIPYVDTTEVVNGNIVRWTLFDPGGSVGEVQTYNYDNGTNPYYSLNIGPAFFAVSLASPFGSFRHIIPMTNKNNLINFGNSSLGFRFINNYLPNVDKLGNTILEINSISKDTTEYHYQ